MKPVITISMTVAVAVAMRAAIDGRPVKVAS
jgi:hypothetical protein